MAVPALGDVSATKSAVLPAPGGAHHQAEARPLPSVQLVKQPRPVHQVERRRWSTEL